MTPIARHPLLEDTLHPDALAESLGAVRRAARHRRVRRRIVRSGAAIVAVAVAAGLATLRSPWSVVVVAPPAPPPASTESTPPAPPRSHVVVTTASAPPTMTVHTAAAPRLAVFTTASVDIVSSRDTGTPLVRASEDDLFAAAGTRPAALHRLADGSARWMWLDLPLTR